MLIDLHCDTILKIQTNGGALKRNDYHIDIDKLIMANSMVQFFAMFVYLEETDTPYSSCLEMIDTYKVEVDKNSSEIAYAYSYNDIIQNNENKKISAVLTIEEGAVLEGDIIKLHNLFKLGVRSITLTWNYENEIGYPNREFKHSEEGLKPFGIDVIKEMNKLGMLIDVSHLSDAGFYDCIKHSNKPIIASHSNSRVVCDNSRNLTDDMIIALHKNGGVMGMNFYGKFLNGSEYSNIKDIVRHIKHIRNLVGVDVIAIGTDFDGIQGALEISDISMIYLLSDALQYEKFTEEEIDKMFYKNALRVFKDVLI